MKKLSKADINRRNAYVESLRELQGKIEDEISALKETAFADLNRLVDAYNEELEEARAFIEDIGNEMEGYYDDRSDKWRDDDAGVAYAEWKEPFTQFDGSPVDHFEVEISAEDGFNHADEIEEMLDEPNA